MKRIVLCFLICLVGFSYFGCQTDSDWDKEDYEKRINELTEQNEALVNENNALKADISKTEAEKKSQEDSLRAKIAELTSSYQNEAALRESQLKELNEALNAKSILENEMGSYKERISELEQLNEQIQGYGDLETLVNEFNKKTEELNELQTKYDALLAGSGAGSSEAAAEYQRQIESLNQTISQQQSELQESKDSLAALNTELETLKKKFSEVEEKVLDKAIFTYHSQKFSADFLNEYKTSQPKLSELASGVTELELQRANGISVSSSLRKNTRDNLWIKGVSEKFSELETYIWAYFGGFNNRQTYVQIPSIPKSNDRVTDAIELGKRYYPLSLNPTKVWEGFYELGDIPDPPQLSLEQLPQLVIYQDYILLDFPNEQLSIKAFFLGDGTHIGDEFCGSTRFLSSETVNYWIIYFQDKGTFPYTSSGYSPDVYMLLTIFGGVYESTQQTHLNEFSYYSPEGSLVKSAGADRKFSIRFCYYKENERYCYASNSIDGLKQNCILSGKDVDDYFLFFVADYYEIEA